ncbi:hypothetical protein JK363_36125 [Streptomyces sp. 205]|uniref:PE-PGRS family protein n=1 Tax=Streptomyces coffeae TaxID=621382 RepID=A0ABS1NPS6_9ACTN|nr:hypothetical protein [Streptomyces coffeae]
MVKFSVGDTMSAETTRTPLTFAPRFDFSGPQVIVAGYTDPEGRERQLAHTFGSAPWLWSEDDEFRFDQAGRELSHATFSVPPQSAPADSCRRVPDGPDPLPGGLRADTAENFALPQTTVFCCDPEAAELRCVRDLGVLDRPLDARIGIAPDVTLLVQEGAVAGWSLTDPARYLTDGFAEPEATAPSPATRRRLAECLDLVSSPLVDEVMDQDAAAWRMLRTTERALRDQREDRRRADVLHQVISRLMEDYEP